MLEILKQLISLVIKVIHTIFYIDIEITPTFHAPLGLLLLAAAFLCLLLVCVFNALGINFGGDDD